MSNIKRYPESGWVAGICAGVAEYFGWNVKLLRALVAAALFFTGFFPVGVIYLIMWYVLETADGEVDGRSRHGYASSTSSGARDSASTGDVKARFARLEQRLRNLEECVTSRDFELRREFRKLEV